MFSVGSFASSVIETMVICMVNYVNLSPPFAPFDHKQQPSTSVSCFTLIISSHKKSCTIPAFHVGKLRHIY